MDQQTAQQLASYIGQLVGEMIKINLKLTAAEEILSQRDPDLVREYRNLVREKTNAVDTREADQALSIFQARLSGL
jgi:hypothetical protein